MFKKIFKISLTITVATLIAALVTLPFAVSSGVQAFNAAARYAAYTRQYERDLTGITQVNIRFTGKNYVSVELESGRTEPDIQLYTDGFFPYDAAITEEVEGGTLNLTVALTLKEEFAKWEGVMEISQGFAFDLKLPEGVPVTFDESETRVSYYETYYSSAEYNRLLRGFDSYCGEPLADYPGVSSALYHYAVGDYTRAEFDAAFDRASTTILADVAETLRNSEIQAANNRREAYRDYQSELDFYSDYDDDTASREAASIEEALQQEYERIQSLPANTPELVQTYLDCVKDYLAASMDAWCALNDGSALLKQPTASLDALRQSRTSAESALTAARRALYEAADGCVYAEYIFEELRLDY